MSISVHRLFELIQSRAFSTLKAEIAEGVVAYRRGLQERGRSASVAVVGHAARAYVVDAPTVVALCDARLGGALDDVELCYLATVLDLDSSFHVSVPEVGEAIEALSEFDGKVDDLLAIKTSVQGLRPNTSFERMREG